MLSCGVCKLIFLNSDDIVAHKSGKCQSSQVKSSSKGSDIEITWHSHEKLLPASSPICEEEGLNTIQAKPYPSDMLSCGSCKMIFFNLDDIVAHKSEECQASQVKSTSEGSDVKIACHSHKTDSPKFSITIAERVKLKFRNQTSTKVENIDKIKIELSETEDEVFSPLAVSKLPGKSVTLRHSHIETERKSALVDESHLNEDSPGPSSATPGFSVRNSVAPIEWKPIDLNTPAVSKLPGKSVTLRHSHIEAERESTIVDESHLKKESPEQSSPTPGFSVRNSVAPIEWKPIDLNTPAVNTQEYMRAAIEKFFSRKPEKKSIVPRRSTRLAQQQSAILGDSHRDVPLSSVSGPRRSSRINKNLTKLRDTPAVSKLPGKSVTLRHSHIEAERESTIVDESHLKKESPEQSSPTPGYSVRNSVKPIEWKPIDLNTPAVSKLPGKSVTLRHSHIEAERESTIVDESHLKKESPEQSSPTPGYSVRNSVKPIEWKPIDLNTPAVNTQEYVRAAIEKFFSRKPEKKRSVPRHSTRIAPRRSTRIAQQQSAILGALSSRTSPRRSSRINKNLTKLRDTPGNLPCTKTGKKTDGTRPCNVVPKKIMHDLFYDDAVFRRARSVITLFSSVVGKRVDKSGKVDFLLHWHPENIVPDTWVSVTKLNANRRKTISVSRLPGFQ